MSTRRASGERLGWPGPRAALGLILVGYALWGAFYIYRTSFVVSGTRVFCLWDDAMISMRYARNLTEGHGLVWNPGGERVQGISNLGITLVMAALHLLPVSGFKVSLLFQLVNLALLLLVLGLMFDLARVTFGGRSWTGVTAALVGALCAPLAVWSLQGSDVGAVSLVVTAALWLVARRARPPAGWPAGVFPWLALGVVLRPDVVVIYLTFLLFVRSLGGSKRDILLGVAILCLVWAGLLAFGSLYYGDPLPNPYYLKATGLPWGLVWKRGLWELALFVQMLSPIVLAFMIASLVLWRGDRVVRLCAATVGAALAYNAGVGGDWLPGHMSRFVVPVMPALIVLFVGWCWSTVERLLTPAPAGSLKGGLLCFLFALMAVPSFNPPGPRREWLFPGETTLLRSANSEHVRHALYFKTHTDPDTRIAFYWAGAPAYFSERPAIDVLGKSDRHIAKLRVARFYPGHSKWDWDYVLRQLRPHVFHQVGRGLEEHPEFREQYRLVDSAEGLQFFVRSDALGKLRDRQTRVAPLD